MYRYIYNHTCFKVNMTCCVLGKISQSRNLVHSSAQGSGQKVTTRHGA